MNNKELISDKRAFTIKEAAEYACVCRSTVKNWIARGILPYEDLPGKGSGFHRFRRIRKEDIDEFLDHFYNQEQVDDPEEEKKIIQLQRTT